VNNTEPGASKQEICGFVTDPGTYIGIKIRNSEEKFRSLYAQSIVASIIYWLLLAGVCFQMLNVIVGKPPRWKLKLFFGLIMFTFLLIRAVYFIVYPIGVLEDQPVASYLVFEFPTFLFLVMNSTVIYLWTEILITVRTFSSGGEFRTRILGSWVAWNFLVLLSFTAFIIAYYTIANHDVLSCALFFSLKPSSSEVAVSYAYVIFVAILCFIMAAAFVVSGASVIFPVCSHHVQMTSARKSFILRTWIVMSIFALCFVTKSILLLIAANSDLIIPVIVFSLLEQIPTAVLLIYIQPPVALAVKSKFTMSRSSQKTRTRSRGSKDDFTGSNSRRHKV